MTCIIAAMDMPWTRRLFPLALAVGVALVTIEMIRRRKLREQYAITWLLASAVLLAFAIFPDLVSYVSRTLKVNYLTIIVLACFFFLAMIVMHFAMVISRQAEQIRQLAERLALLRRQVEGRAGRDKEAGAA